MKKSVKKVPKKSSKKVLRRVTKGAKPLPLSKSHQRRIQSLEKAPVDLTLTSSYTLLQDADEEVDDLDQGA